MSTAISMSFTRGLALVVGVSLLLSAMVPLLAPAPIRASSHVWINEFHYDNTGTDTGEAIEVAGAAGTDLSGWSIVLYNGNGGIPYGGDPVALSGVLPNDPSGVGTAVVTYPSNGIQNGSPDGIALVDPTDMVVQFLSYEGSFTAVGGAADGMTSTDIGVLQDGSEPVGDSLQLTGVGTSYADFSWAESQPATFGNVNAGQTFGSEALPTLDCPNVTTDVGTAASTPISATDANGTVVAIDLASVTPSTDQISLTDFTPSPAAGEAATATLAVSAAAPVDIYTVQLSASTDDDPAQTGSCSLTVTVQEPTELPEGVVISEVYGGGGNSGATYANDFVELFNRTPDAVSLDGWSVQHASATGTSWAPTLLEGSIAPGGYYLVQLAAGTSGGGAPLPTADAIGSRNIGASSGKIALVAMTGALSGTCPLDVSVDFVGYGGTADCAEGDAPAGPHSNTTSLIRAGAGATDTDDNAADFTTGAPNPQNSEPGTEPPPVSCGTATHFIHDVQGSGLSSDLVGQTVIIEGVVTGFFRGDDPEEIGYFVQEEDEETDDSPQTSEGIMVHDPANLATVDALPDGAVISVRGTVHEHFGKTRLTSVSGFADCDITDGVTVADLSLPATDSTSFEPHEGMLVQFEQALTISEYFNFGQFGEIVLTVGRDFQPTAVAEPGSPEADALALDNELNRITLDDASSLRNPDPARHPNGAAFTLENRFRGGDTVSNVTGVLDYAFGDYRVQPTQGADYAVGNPRPGAPDDVGGSLTVASFNVLNYFTTLDLGPDICGPDGIQECRGADNATELERQRAKIVAAMAAMDSDVVGLIEIENHPGDVPTADLVAGLNDVLGAGTYDYVETGAIGTDAIRVALIYKPGSVTPVGEFAILDSTVDERFDDAENRPVLAQAFEENATGGVVTVAVNHLKSKGSACTGDFDPQQGNCNGVRTMAADALVDWLATDPTESGDLDSLIVGDLNAYDKEDPIDEVRAGPDDAFGTGDDYTDLLLAFEGELAYSYVFDGQLGYLDHALASATLSPQVTGATVWHINADEPSILDYDTSFKKPAQDALYAPDPYRSSDHDPVIVGLDLLAYGFDEFGPPVDESNTARAGSTIAVKFELDGDFGPEVLFEAPQVVGCGESPPFTGAEDADHAGSSGFRYDADDDQYVFAWKTDRAWAGDCMALVLTLRDGTYVVTEFAFR